MASQIVDAVHAKGSFIYLQLWAAGRAANLEVLEKEGHYPYISASDIALSTSTVKPRPLNLTGMYIQHAHLYSTTEGPTT